MQCLKARQNMMHGVETSAPSIRTYANNSPQQPVYFESQQQLQFPEKINQRYLHLANPVRLPHFVFLEDKVRYHEKKGQDEFNNQLKKQYVPTDANM